MKPELIKPFEAPAALAEEVIPLFNEQEIFTRDGKDFQILVMPVVLSLPIRMGLTDFNELSALPAMASIIGKLPWFQGRAVDVAPRLFYGTRMYSENIVSSVDLARTGNWDLVTKNTKHDPANLGVDVTVLDRLVCVRHIYIRVAGIGPVREAFMPLPPDAESKLREMLRFALGNHSTQGSSETMFLLSSVKVLPIVPFASAILGFEPLRIRAVLSHIATAAVNAEGGKQPIAYQTVNTKVGKNQLKVMALKQRGEWQIEAVLNDLFVAIESPDSSEAVAKALLIEMAAAYEVTLENLDAPKVSH